ncbi:MAG: GNAT family N-acetyltransferase [Terracidiphilus sp.]|jgi:predicted GNAT superfamily acetyltransferase
MIEIRACQGLDELEACVQLQIATWGYDETDVIPRKTFLLAQKIGGQVIGAFDSENSSELGAKAAHCLVGFAMSLPGVKTIEGHPFPYLHSHMLAVRESHRNRGIGAQLKWEQRHEALSRGIRHMEWTFDPLEIKNAFLNIHRLGAISCEYRVDFYGVSSSRLQGGLPTDRLLAVWKLDSPRVEGICAQLLPDEHEIQERIMVPVSIDIWKADEATRERALAVQLQIRQQFLKAFSQGLAVLGFSRDSEGNGIFELSWLSR